MAVKRKSFEFDLSKAALEECGFKVNGIVAEKLVPYNLMSKALKSLGFEHQQYSVYYSKKPLTRGDVESIIDNLDCQLPWLNKCVMRFDVADVVAHHDLKGTLRNAATIRESQIALEPIKDIEVKKSSENSIDFDEIAVQSSVHTMSHERDRGNIELEEHDDIELD